LSFGFDVGSMLAGTSNANEGTARPEPHGAQEL